MHQLQAANHNPLLLLGGAGLTGLLAVLFVRVELLREAPFVPVRLLGRPLLWRVSLVTALHGAALTGLVTLLPLYLAAARGASPAQIALLLLPLSVGIGAGSIASGHLIGRLSRPTLLPLLGLPATAVVLGATALLEPAASAPVLAFASASRRSSWARS